MCFQTNLFRTKPIKIVFQLSLKSSDGTTIKLSQSDKWFKQAGLFKSRGITTTDTGIVYKKISKLVKFVLPRSFHMLHGCFFLNAKMILLLTSHSK